MGLVIEFQIGEPEPIACPWAPPPMLVEPPPPPPFEGAFWTGGFWTWQGTWVWVHGRWAAPPQPGSAAPDQQPVEPPASAPDDYGRQG